MFAERERLTGLIDYVEATERDRLSIVLDVADHRGFRQAGEEAIRLPGVRVDERSDTDHVWLSVDRLSRCPAPLPGDAELRLWLEPSDDPAVQPKLKAELPRSATTDPELREGEGTVRLDSVPALKTRMEAALGAYRREIWAPWAGEERPRRRAIELYNGLFSLRQMLDGAGDKPVELVWGIGMARWKRTGGTLSYPLLTVPVELSLNQDSHAIEVRPRSEALPAVESDALDALGAGGINEWRDATAKYLDSLTADGLSPFAPESFAPVLRRAVALLDPDGHYLPDLGERPAPGPESLRVDDKWMLFERPRRATDLMDDLRRFKSALAGIAEAGDLPEAVRVLLQTPAEALEEEERRLLRGVSTIPGVTSADGSGDDLFFPKPFNREQVEVIQRLSSRPGVVVQGPPGTGKTHTIANIISHYLAEGKRVLVTSQKAPPLKVLRDKLPEAVRPLAVSLLESDRDGLKQFQESVDIIADRLHRTRPGEVRRQIAALDARIDALHRSLANIDRQVEQIGRQSMSAAQIGGSRIEPARAARDLIAAGALARWIEDPIDAIASHEPEFDEEAIARLRASRKAVGERIGALALPAPPSDLPDAAAVLELHDALVEADAVARSIPADATLRDGTTPDQLGALAADLQALDQARNAIEQTRLTWSDEVAARLRRDAQDPSLSAVLGLAGEVELLCAEEQHFMIRPVLLPEGAELDGDFREAIGRLVRGETIGLFRNLFGPTKARIAAVRLAARQPKSDEEWAEVERFLAALDRSDRLVASWNHANAHAGLDAVASRDPAAGHAMRRQLGALAELQDLVAQERKVDGTISELMPGWQRKVAGDAQAAREVGGAIEQHGRWLRLERARAGQRNLAAQVRSVPGAIGDELRAIGDAIGTDRVAIAEIDRRWTAALTEAALLRSLGPDFNVIRQVTTSIEESGAPTWAARLRTEPVTGIEDPLTPGDWRNRWTLRRLETWLTRIDMHDQLRALGRERTESEQQLQRAYEEAIELRTWCRLAEQASDQVRSALASYAQAMRKLGRGTGIRAGRYRADARAASDRAKNALPCWIMPHYRVSESLPAEFGLFDLVIVDEASQSTVAALPALLRAKQILIVGDDRQVSPEAGFREESRMNLLADRHLSGQVADYRSALREDRSLYDLGTVVFAGGAILLKEHFRCVAPIIEYSKGQFYSHQLVPLRLPSSSERLDPPLIDILVTDGFRRGKVNQPEVDCIVDQIGRIAADPTMAGRTIGVTTLLGQEQAIAILAAIEQVLGSELMLRHDIRVGEPAAFQGDERDIMFVSLVADRGSSPVTGLGFEQRFNVAASRARDRMVLVRSVELEELRASDKLRRSLIEHFHAPFAAERALVEDRRARCESPFETEMFDLLAERGYRVDTQVKVGTFRIDMVVEGAEDRRLAIECDGDAYHGPEQWPDDMARQRMLERAGWTVWRCFASRFVRDRQGVIEELVAELSRRGITPEQGDALPPSRHCEHRRWRSTPEEPAGEPVPYAWLVPADPF